MHKLLDGQNDLLGILQEQYKNSVVKSRQFTGSGFYTTFKLDKSVPKIEFKNTFQIGDVIGEIKGINNGIGFVLFIKDGLIDFLEGYSYGDEKWLEFIEDYRLLYISGDKRNLESFKKYGNNIIE